MADAQRKIEEALVWLLTRAELLKTSIHKHDWIEQVFPDHTDIACTFDFRKKPVYTWGAAENEDLALLKAFSEGIERIAMMESGAANSNGFAAHLDREQAILAAKNELIERDLLLCHILTKTPFLAYQTPAEWTWYFRAKAWVTALGGDLNLYKVGSKGILAKISGLNSPRPFGFITGLSYKSEIEAAAMSAFIEAGRHYNVYSLPEKTLKPMSLREFEGLSNHSFSAHGDLALDTNYAEQMSFMFDQTEQRLATPAFYPELPVDRISCDEVIIQDPSFLGSPFVVYRAHSDRAQKLFAGKTESAKINFKRLSEFSGKEENESTINKLPHFLN